jgi:aspartate racemase
MKETIGIVGGMGSHATAAMFQQFILKSPAGSDQEHMEILLHNNPCIPDRTMGILHGGADPLPELARSVRLLEQCGATTIILACITAHFYYDRLKASLTKAKLFHILQETADFACSMYPNIRNVGILATEGTCRSGLWQKEFANRHINAIVLPDPYQKDYVTDVIYGPLGIKAGYTDDAMKRKLIDGCGVLRELGAEAVIGGCSELPLLISKEDVSMPYIDSVQAAVDKLIDTYYCEVR